MKTVLRILAGVVVLLLLAGAGLYVFRAPLAGWAMERALAGAGIEEADIRISELTSSRTVLEITSPEISGDVKTAYRLADLLREREVDTLILSNVEVTAILSETGELRFPGLSMTGAEGSNQSGALPFRQLTVEKAIINLKTPEGDALINLDGSFAPESGIEASVNIRTNRAGLTFLVFEEAEGFFT
ncbi:MAG: hypothetical protein AAGA69_00860, partial [Pseudomonadota bacterium]